MNKLKFIINEIKKGRIIYLLFSIFTYPLSKTRLKEWRLKTKDEILVRNLTNEIKKRYCLNFLNEYSKFYCESLREIFEDKIYDYFRIRKCDIVYDVGASAGEYAILCAKNGAECLAFELRKEAYELMNENIRINNLQDKIMTFLGKIDNENNLDFYFKKTKKVPSIIKIDVEGDEFKILIGSKEIIKRFRPKIILETHSKELERNCLNFLSKLNYQIKHKKEFRNEINLFFLEI